MSATQLAWIELPLSVFHSSPARKPLSLSESFKERLGLGTTSEDIKEYMHVELAALPCCRLCIKLTLAQEVSSPTQST